MEAINITVNPDLTGFDKNILEEFKQFAIPRLNKIKTKLEIPVKKIIADGMRSTDHYGSLISDRGQLRVEFGILDNKKAVEDIIQAVQSSIQLDVIPPKGTSLGGIFIGAYRDNFSDALSAQGAQYISVNSAGTSTLIEWLKWLLFEGDVIIIADYGVFGHAKKGSRTGSHIMVKTKKEAGKLQPWRVPPAFAGTVNHNWITDAAKFSAEKITRLLEETGREVLNG